MKWKAVLLYLLKMFSGPKYVSKSDWHKIGLWMTLTTLQRSHGRISFLMPVGGEGPLDISSRQAYRE